MKSTPKLSDRAVRWIRIASTSAGAFVTAAALLADRLGLSAGGAVSRNQILVLAIGLVLLAGGILGRRFPGAWRGFAVLLLNTILVAVLVDMAALVTAKSLFAPELTLRSRKILEGGLDRPRDTPRQSRYTAWTVWRALPGQSGESTDSLGRRITPGSSPLAGEDGIRVFLVGSSTAWGLGAADSVTIAAYLQRELGRSTGQPVEVVNLSQVGYVSTQEVIDLLLELRAGNIPDVVIVLDGFNEIFTAYQSGMAGVHQNFLQTAALLENRVPSPSLLSRLWRTTNTSLLLDLARMSGAFRAPENEYLVNYSTMGVDCDSLAAEVVGICLDNYEVMRALGRAYGFRCVFAWQPTVWTGSKPLTPEEAVIAEGGTPGYEFAGDPAMRDLLLRSYAIYESSMTDSLGECSLTSAFDSVPERVYTDPSGVHLNALGDSLLAASLTVILSDSIQ
jgi:hypothetical protein